MFNLILLPSYYLLQFGSLCLLTGSIVLAHSMKFSKYGQILTRKKALPMGKLSDITKVAQKKV